MAISPVILNTNKELDPNHEEKSPRTEPNSIPINKALTHPPEGASEQPSSLFLKNLIFSPQRHCSTPPGRCIALSFNAAPECPCMPLARRKTGTNSRGLHSSSLCGLFTKSSRPGFTHSVMRCGNFGIMIFNRLICKCWV